MPPLGPLPSGESLSRVRLIQPALADCELSIGLPYRWSFYDTDRVSLCAIDLSKCHHLLRPDLFHFKPRRFVCHARSLFVCVPAGNVEKESSET